MTQRVAELDLDYPVRVDGRIDSDTSRRQWLLKITGRYPRPLFDFVVGVLRWTWRVSFYATGSFATDRYPPFSLGDVPDYPAHLAVAYPEHLSRGLVLVKSWLLALPQLAVVGILAGGWRLGCVLAYVLLLRDEYPPFRLDLGGADPGTVVATPA